MNTLFRISGAVGLGLALSLQPLELLAASSLQAPASQAGSWELARGGGGRGGGGSRGGGGGGRRGSGARTGFSSFSGGGSQAGSRGGSRPAVDRGSRVDTRQGNRSNRVETRQGNFSDRRGDVQQGRTDRTDIRQTNRTDRSTNRQDNRTDRVHDRNQTRRDAINTWDRNRPNWVGPNWAYNRPWRYGWYGGSTWNNWGWWPGRAAAWGIGALATYAVIDSLVDSAVSNQTTYIVVPDSNYSLYYSSVQPSGDVVSFQAYNGSSTQTFSADCRAGLLNGQQPSSGSEAQLLNAACQVAFGQ
jgi:hypothetical protein